MRFTALLLAVMMIAPACWSCPMLAAAAQKAQHSCCCEESPQATHHSADKDADQKPCPCSMSQAPRDCAVETQWMPEATPGLPVFLRPESFQWVPWSDACHTYLSVSNTGPPKVARPLFQRHHAWLL